jgi:hypothetical protein
MKILLIGANGTMGQRILNEALSRGHKVTVLVRDASDGGGQRANVEYQSGDIFNPESVAGAAVDHDVG